MAKKGTEPKKISFEENLGELEKIVTRLEDSDLPLEEAISLYEKGMKLHKSCSKQLDDAKLRIEELTKSDASDDSGDDSGDSGSDAADEEALEEEAADDDPQAEIPF